MTLEENIIESAQGIRRIHERLVEASSNLYNPLAPAIYRMGLVLSLIQFDSLASGFVTGLLLENDEEGATRLIPLPPGGIQTIRNTSPEDVSRIGALISSEICRMHASGQDPATVLREARSILLKSFGMDFQPEHAREAMILH